MRIHKGSLLLFRLFGVNVYVHWLWLLGPVWEFYRFQKQGAAGAAAGGPVHSLAFDALVYLTLFLIVLIHEFGHALACKSVGGKAERIVLWPLGGLASVQPPQRAGAMLWSIAAGPLVNVVLLPVTIIPVIALGLLHGVGGGGGGGWLAGTEGGDYLLYVAIINAALLIFDMLPIYPLDGGQILRSLLWFVVGRSLSLVIAAAVGIAGSVVVLLLAVVGRDEWLGAISLFMGFQSVQAIRYGVALRRIEKAPRHQEYRCPKCGESPPVGPFWGCACGARLDTFSAGGQCPNCGTRFNVTACPMCNEASPIEQWTPSHGFPMQPELMPREGPAEMPRDDAPPPQA